MAEEESSSSSWWPSPTSISTVSKLFKITEYSLLNGSGSGKYFVSDTLSVGGHDWAVYCYPDGKHEADAAYMSLFITLVSEASKDVTALFELALLDQSGSDKHRIHSHFRTMPKTGPYTLKGRESMWGCKKFIKKTVLEASNFLKNDSLFVHCKVGVISKCTEDLD